MTTRCAFFLTACLVLTVPARAGHTLSSEEQQVFKSWLARHSAYRQATDEDCVCSGDIQQMRDYHPYVVTGDFNGDGAEDFAVVLIDRSKQEKNFALIVFNGDFESETVAPAFMESGMSLKQWGLFYGPPRPKPYRFFLSPFHGASGSVLIPDGRSYQWIFFSR